MLPTQGSLQDITARKKQIVKERALSVQLEKKRWMDWFVQKSLKTAKNQQKPNVKHRKLKIEVSNLLF